MIHATVALLLLVPGVALVEVPAAVKPLVEKYGLQVVTTAPTFPVKMSSGVITGKAADPKALARYLTLFVPEFQLYPADLIRRTKLKRLVFCENLAFAGQLRTALPDFEHDTLYYDVARGAENPAYQRKVIHHEYYHLIDLRDDGRLYRDERWAALNTAGFKYGTGGKNAQEVADTGTLTDKYPGFLNHYSTTGVEEDKAEVFALLMMDRAYLTGRSEKERVLAAKVARMQEIMKKFCPEIDGKFWDRAAGLDRAR